MARKKNTPNDPERRERILAATMQILQTSGVGAVSARAVASHAGVPVGSVSYHFDSVRALLLEASRRVIQTRSETLSVWDESVTAETVTARLAELIYDQLTKGRALTVVAYELYILGLRDSEFSALSTSAIGLLRERLLAYCGPEEAARLAAAADGCQLASLFEDPVPTPPQIQAVLSGSS